MGHYRHHHPRSEAKYRYLTDSIQLLGSLNMFVRPYSSPPPLNSIHMCLEISMGQFQYLLSFNPRFKLPSPHRPPGFVLSAHMFLLAELPNASFDVEECRPQLL